MNGGEVFSIILSIFLAFVFGAVAMLFVGGRTALNYWIVKISRGGKVLIFGKTKFGWRSFVGKKLEGTVTWKFDKSPIVTTVSESDVRRYMRLDMIFVDTDNPTSTLKVQEGKMYPEDFDPVVYSNLLTRALTKIDLQGIDNLKKIMIAILFIVVLIGLGVVLIYVKLNELTGGAGGGVI
jgi:hypothetical protein